MRFIARFCFFLSLIATNLNGIVDESAFSADVQVSKEQISLDDRLTVTLKLIYPPEYHPDESLLLEHLLNKDAWGDERFSLVSKFSAPATPSQDGRVIQTLTFNLEPWEVGPQTISFRNIRFIQNIPNQGEPIEIWVDLHSVNVLPSPHSQKRQEIEPELLPPPGVTLLGLDNATKQLLESKNNNQHEAPRNIEIAASRSFPWKTLLFIIGFVLLIWLSKTRLKGIWIKWKNYLSPPLSPKEIALARLKELAGQKLPQQELFEPFYVGLTKVVRSYIENEYLLQAEELTTEEFLQDLQTKELFSEEMRTDLTEFLSSADLVKFARQSATLEECDRAYLAAERFISR